MRDDVMRERLVNAVGRLLRDDVGARELLRHIVQQSGVMTAGYMDNAAWASYREGQRSVGLILVLLAREAGCVDKLLT